MIDKVDKELDEQSAILNDSSEVEGGYPHILDPEFNTKISKKREFNQYKHDIDYSIPIDKVDDLCDSDFELTPKSDFCKTFSFFKYSISWTSSISWIRYWENMFCYFNM